MSRTRSSMPEPSLQARAHSDRVAALIRGEIDAAGGAIGFDRFMELALYAPGLGYYAAGARKFGTGGAGGDFVTAPEISPLFARALATQVAQVLRLTAPHVVEFGAGTGRLACDLLAALDAQGIDVQRYDIVELSPDLRQRQGETIADARVRWLDAPPGGMSGAIIANEVLDVMPVRLFVRGEGDVEERAVVLREGSLAFASRPADSQLAAAVAGIEAEVGRLPAGYGSELGLVARGWMRSAGRWLERGALLAIDYTRSGSWAR